MCSQVPSNLSAVCGSYFGSNSGQNSAIHPCADRDSVSCFMGLLEHMHMEKELLLKLSTIDIARYEPL